MRRLLIAAAAAALLTSCGEQAGGADDDGGGSGAQTAAAGAIPQQMHGTWAADCAQPFVRVEANRVHVYPDNQTYDVKTAALNGAEFSVTYQSAQGEMTDVYAVEGETLRLARTEVGGQQMTWQKQPMRRCP
jgi:hypothetical protein